MATPPSYPYPTFGGVTLQADPAVPEHAARKGYVDGAIANIAGAGLILDPATGKIKVDSAAPTALSGTPLGTDQVVIVRGTTTYYVPVSALTGTSPATATAATLAGTPTTGTAGTPLAATTVTTTPSSASAFMTLYTGGADVGSRVAVASGATFSATPAAAGTFTVRAYAAATGGTPLAESAAITVAAAAAKIGPDLVMTSATYAAGQNGQALSGGSGLSPALTLASGSRTIKMRVFVPTATHNVVLIQFNQDNNKYFSLINGAITGSYLGNTSTSVIASGWHDIRIEEDTVANPGYGQTRIYVDGTSIMTYGSYVADVANPTVRIDMDTAQGVLLDELTIHYGLDTTVIPANGYPAGTANLVADWAFNGNGLSR